MRKDVWGSFVISEYVFPSYRTVNLIMINEYNTLPKFIYQEFGYCVDMDGLTH